VSGAAALRIGIVEAERAIQEGRLPDDPCYSEEV
jgi:hypothetical protein